MSEITRLVKAIAPNLFDEGREVCISRGPRGGALIGSVQGTGKHFSAYVIRKAIRLGIIGKEGKLGERVADEYYARSKEVTGGTQQHSAA